MTRLHFSFEAGHDDPAPLIAMLQALPAADADPLPEDVPKLPHLQTYTEPDPTRAFIEGDPLAGNVPPPVPPPTRAETDADGLPWDGRIHASSKKCIADGTWRKKRGVDSEVVEFVEAELKTAMASALVTSTLEEIDTVEPLDTAMSYGEFMRKVTASDVPPATVAAILSKHGLAGMHLLAARQDLIPTINAEMFPGVV